MTATGDTATSKLELIMGRDGLARLADSTVMVLGVGGVGSNCVEALARGGVGRRHRGGPRRGAGEQHQPPGHRLHSTIGRKKVDVARAMVADINPAAQVEALDRFVLAENVPEFLDAHAGGADYVVDAIDTISAKLAIAQYADARGLRLDQQHGRGEQAASRMLPVRRRVRHGELPAVPHHAQGGAQARHPAACACCTRASSRCRARARGRGAPRAVEPGHRLVRAAHHGPDDRRRGDLRARGDRARMTGAMTRKRADTRSLRQIARARGVPGTFRARAAPHPGAARAKDSRPCAVRPALPPGLRARHPGGRPGAGRAAASARSRTTVTPAGYARARELADRSNVRVGLGLHPWWIADGRFAAKTTWRVRAVGEGRALHRRGGPRLRPGSASRRARPSSPRSSAWRGVLGGGKVLSIHAVKAAGEALDVLERAGALAGNACIFHWFSGTSDELQRAVRAGCFFSINPRMLATKRGRAYAPGRPGRPAAAGNRRPSEAGRALRCARRSRSARRHARSPRRPTSHAPRRSCRPYRSDQPAAFRRRLTRSSYSRRLLQARASARPCLRACPRLRTARLRMQERFHLRFRWRWVHCSRVRRRCARCPCDPRRSRSRFQNAARRDVVDDRCRSDPHPHRSREPFESSCRNEVVRAAQAGSSSRCSCTGSTGSSSDCRSCLRGS